MWEQRYFKGKKVFVEVDETGEVILARGLATMRYQDKDDAKTYNASPANLSLEEGPQPAASTTRAPSKTTSSATKKTTAGTKPDEFAISCNDSSLWGPLYRGQEVPHELLNEAPPEAGIVEIYTDGACSGNPGPCGYGVVVRDGDKYLELNQYLGTGTNNIGELMAIKIALQNVSDPTRTVRIYTDSTYCIGVLTQGWKAKANQELILEIKKLLPKFTDLKFFKVKGHAGHPLNERADTMATSSLNRMS